MALSPHSITIDKWINESKFRVSPPAMDTLIPFRTLEYLIWQDDVECILRVQQKETSADNMFSKFLLTLCLRVPASSRFLVYWQRSPIMVIDQYTGKFDDARAPAWLQAQRLEYRFWQPRSLMLDLILYFVANVNAAENAGLAFEVESWCKALSIPASGISTSFKPRTIVQHFAVSNARSHKKRASDLSAKELQRLRKKLNKEISPLQTRK